MRGAETVNIGDRSLDYLMTPKSLKAGNSKGFVVPVRLKGSGTTFKFCRFGSRSRKNLEKELKAAEEKIKRRQRSHQ